ncbi:MAG: 2-hydroxyacyl-CoA dehydratase family protein [Desulfobacterales bacterium]|nr:2-hydroxyacyl-CoA dehydratase family protein [Desulfobacterales bacterium]
MKRIRLGCAPLYPPTELLHAMGLTPISIWGKTMGRPAKVPLADSRLQPYVCGLARQLTQQLIPGQNGSDNGLSLDGLLFYNACDTLRNLPEILTRALPRLPLLTFHLPEISLESGSGQDCLAREIQSLIQNLENTFGCRFSRTRFHDSVLLFRELRRAVEKLEQLAQAGKLNFSDWVDLMEELPAQTAEAGLEKLNQALASAPSTPRCRGPRILVSGIRPPANPEDVDRAGLWVVADDFALAHRSHGYIPKVTDDPLAYYLDLYTHHIPCSTLHHTAPKRWGHLKTRLCQSRAQGVVFWGEKFCEYEYFDLPDIREKLRRNGFPSLALETSLDGGVPGETQRTRLEAFAELLENSPAPQWTSHQGETSHG